MCTERKSKLGFISLFTTAVIIVVGFVPVSAWANLGDELFKLTTSDAAASDFIGNANSVSISGNLALLGARGNDDDGNFSGSAYLFDVSTGNELSIITASDAEEFDLFGSAAAISGNIALVGSAGGGDASETSGAAYLFDMSDPFNPVELHKLLPSEWEQSDGFGSNAATNGNVALLGAVGRFSNTSIGQAFLFDVTTGNELSILTASDGMGGNSFGRSVGISGNIAIIGASLDDEAGSAAGAAYLFDISDPENPVELHKLIASDAATSDQLGWSVGISGNLAVVGARLDADAGSQSGSAYLFDVATGNQLAKLTASDAAGGDELGVSVAISSNTVLIGANQNDDAGGDAGTAYLFDVSNPLSPIELIKLTASDAAAEDRFGESVAISGNTALVGALHDDDGGSSSGSVYVFSAVPEPCSLALLLVLTGLMPLNRRGHPLTQ